MAETNYGGDYKPQMKLDGNKVIMENIGCYDGSVDMVYRKEVVYHFKNEEEATEFYYKKK